MEKRILLGRVAISSIFFLDKAIRSSKPLLPPFQNNIYFKVFIFIKKIVKF